MPATANSFTPLSVRPHPHLIEIPAWTWLEELSQRQGHSLTLAGVPDPEWDRLRGLGFDLVWLMGVWKRSRASRRVFLSNPSRFADYDRALPGWKLADVVGSPYAIAKYQPDSRIGTWREIDAVRRKLRDRGMGLVLDFVSNHTALDHPWVGAHPEYYLEGTEQDFQRDPGNFTLMEQPGGKFRFLARGRDPYFPSWADTAQLNHFQPATRAALVDVVRELARHADGLRCDMAMLALNDIFAGVWPRFRPSTGPSEEFWPAAIGAAPELIWLAEAYWDTETRLQQLGFHYAYDKRFYDAICAGSAAGLRQHLTADFGYQQRLARFLENHDEQRAATVFAGRMQAPATLAATAPGLRFYFHGQLDGRRIHQPVELARAAQEPADAEARSLYQRLLAITNEEAFHTGRWSLLEAGSAGNGSNQNLIAYQWRSSKSWKLVAANLSGQTSDGRIALGNAATGAGHWVLSDQLNGVDYARPSAELAGGLYIRLDPWRAHVFDVSPGH
ncbi:MAG TPA: alpha-amylase family glycosyl hydrolase [Candidatus Acidoferrales bacterium]|nr:alpha-amylase family glycosyl hydrolase [Candidatus Acidoferrales bacterium]